MANINTDRTEYLKEERNASWREELRKSKKNKERTDIHRVEMPTAPALERARSYVEVNVGLSVDQAVVEASRCIDCPDPTCVQGCPVGVNIPKFIKNIERGEYLEAPKPSRKPIPYLQFAVAFVPRKSNVNPTVFTK